MRPKIAILASGTGTTAEAVVSATQNGKLDAEVALVVYNNPGAGIKDLQVIKTLNIPTICINSNTHPGRGEKGSMTDPESQAILNAVKDAGCDLVVLLGYLKKVSGALLDELGQQSGRKARILNTHPGPLPQTAGYYGRATHQTVYDLYLAGSLSKTGPTLHQVSANYDEGSIVQYADTVILTTDDTPESIENKVRRVERDLTPVGINKYLKEVLNG